MMWTWMLLGAAAAVGANDHFGDEQRHGNQEQAQQVTDDKGGTAVLPGQIRKAPQITQAHGGG